jgi:hypothetical protein
MAGSIAPVYPKPTLVNPKGLRRWRTAYADALATPAWIYVVGNSIAAGIGIDGTSSAPLEIDADPKSWAGRLRTRFATQFGVNEAGGIMASGPFVNSRVTVDTTGSTTAGFMGFTQGVTSTSGTGGAAGTVSHTLRKCTAFDVYYYEHDGSPVSGQSMPTTGAFTLTVDGGSPTTVAHGSGVNVYKSSSQSGLSNAPHTVVVTGASANTAYDCMMRYHSGVGVGVVKLGKPGYTTRDILGAGTNSGVLSAGAQIRTLGAFSMVGNGGILVFEETVNSWQSQVAAGQLSTPAQYQSDLQSIVNTVVAAGGCVLLLGDPPSPLSNPVGGTADYSAYFAVMQAVAASTDHVAFASLRDAWSTSPAAVANGLQISTSIHPTRAGHGDIANIVFGLITRREIPLV